MSFDRKILSIDSDDDDDNYDEFKVFLQDDTNRKKNTTILEIEEMGGQYLKEIERKKKSKDLKKIKLIPYILKYSKNRYDKEELISYSFEDVQSIYNEIKKENRSIFTKIFHFIFNVE